MMSSVRQLACGVTALGLALSAGAALAAPCPPSVLATPKGNQLYLYFPTTADASFPLWANTGPGSLTSGATSPLQPFNVADLDPTIGTTAQLRNLVYDFVVDDYCEFNVKVNQTTAAPSPTVPRWQIVGVGTDSASAGGALFGIAQAVDTNDSNPQDYARVFGKSFKDACGGPGGALTGANSTLLRWATAIGETTAHEAAHNYGAAHGHSAPKPTEDGQNWHIMATGSTGLTCALRATRNRHFSDTEYEILGHNIGLNVKTLHNWDFVNPNNTNADCMRIRLLSNVNSLNIGWWYNGSMSPWQNPTVTFTGSSQWFQGTSYFVHHLDFSSPKSWSGLTPGVVIPDDLFHTGATFTGSPTVIVFDVQLYSGGCSAGTMLPLAPRLAGYDTGDVDEGSGDFNLNFFNTAPAAGALRLAEVQVFRSPRMIDINSMMATARPVDIQGAAVELTPVATFRNIELAERASLRIGNLRDKRSVDIQYADDDCPQGSIGTAALSVGDGETEMKYCHQGNALSLFPATYTYVIATVVDPKARYWDRERREFVTGPRQNILYYQLGGFVPDFNDNGIDDLIDIRTGTSRDEDRNGIPDEVRPESAGGGESQIRR